MWRAVFLALLLTIPRPAKADTVVCLPHQDLLAALLSQYHERPVAFWLSPSPELKGPRLIELLRADDGSTWSLVATDVAGRSCLVLGLSSGVPA